MSDKSLTEEKAGLQEQVRDLQSRLDVMGFENKSNIQEIQTKLETALKVSLLPTPQSIRSSQFISETYFYLEITEVCSIDMEAAETSGRITSLVTHKYLQESSSSKNIDQESPQTSVITIN